MINRCSVICINEPFDQYQLLVIIVDHKPILIMLNGVTLPTNFVLATYSDECGKYERVAVSDKTKMYNL